MPAALRDLVAMTTRLAVEDCLSVLPPDSVQPDHVAHLTSVHVVKVEMELRDLLAARATASARQAPDVMRLARRCGLDAEQAQAAATLALTDPLVVVEGAAGSGKTTMLGAAIKASAAQGRTTKIVTPTDSVAKLVYEHGWRWNRDGVWTRLNPGDTDPETGRPTPAPPLARGSCAVSGSW